MAGRVCETSLRWMLAVRRQGNVHQYRTQSVLDTVKHPEVLGDRGGDFGHTIGSLLWSIDQARAVERVGLDAWLESEAARGYEHWLQGWLKGLR